MRSEISEHGCEAEPMDQAELEGHHPRRLVIIVETGTVHYDTATDEGCLLLVMPSPANKML